MTNKEYPMSMYASREAREVDIIRDKLNEIGNSDMSAILFDGFAVFNGLSDKARARTSPENVSDVLDSIVKLIRTTNE